MNNADKQLLSLWDYPAKLVFGRATTDGVLVLVDSPTFNNAMAVIQRIEALNLDNPAMPYKYEVASLDDVEMKEAEMRLSLIKEAHDKGLPTWDWE